MLSKPQTKTIGAAGAIIALGLLAAPLRLWAQSVCAVVKLEILQTATLERQGFDAHLAVSNNVPTSPLTNLKVQIFIKDANGNPADSLFFVKTATLTNVNAVDGTGIVQSSSTADIHWLIIPSTGAGGTNPAGQRYGVTAIISALSNNVPQNINTFPAFITVQPQPAIKLEYALPFEVFADEPLTPQIEPVEPFPLAVRVTNVGYGTANNFQIQSAQPQILDNKQGLQIDFKLLGTNVGGQTIPNTLLIPFGNVAPQQVSQAWWIMSTSLSGRFTSFTSTFTHAADLGGQLTSLIQNVTTYTLLKDVLIDLPGRDSVPDFLVNATFDRSSMQAMLDSGVQPPAQFVLESDQPTPLIVTEVPGAVSGTLGGTSAALAFRFAQGVSSNVWVHSYAPFTPGGSVSLVSATRGDGKIVNPRNVWISKHFVKSTLQDVYWINVLDLTGSTNTYTLQFNPSGLDVPPGAVKDLAAATVSSGGSLGLTWSAPGEDGYTGYLFGGRYFFDPELSSAAAFSPSFAQASITTSTPAGAAQAYVLSNLVGNATYYVALFTQDTGGNMSALSNVATAYTLPNPPNGLALSNVTKNGLNASWQAGNNSLPIEYAVFLTTRPAGPVVSSSPYQDSFNRSYTFSGLSLLTTYYIYGVAAATTTGVSSPLALLGSTVTPSGLDLLPPRTTLSAGTPGFSASPALLYATQATTFTLSAVDDALTIGDGAGAGVARTSLAIDTTTFYPYLGFFSLVGEGTHTVSYFSVDLVGHVESSRTVAVDVDLTPPITAFQVFGSSAVDASGHVEFSSITPVGFAAADPVSSGVASGVGSTFYAIDADPASPACRAAAPNPGAPAGTCANPAYAGPFTLALGTHTVYYFSQDRVGNRESERSLVVDVRADALPPRTTLVAGAPSFSTGTIVYATSVTTFGLTAVDDARAVGDAAGVGVARSYVAVDTSVYSAYAGTFSLAAEGVHAVSYYSVDLASNTELASTTTVGVDLTAPITSLQALGPSAASAGGVFVSSFMPIALSAVDPVSKGVASGVGATFVAVDSGPYGAYAGPFLLSAGSHSVSFYSKDKVGNQETPSSATVFVDTVPPSTVLSLLRGPQYLAAGATIPYVSAGTYMLLVATDPAAGGFASGVANVAYTDRVGGQIGTQNSAGAASLLARFQPTEGLHALTYASVDRAGNAEVPKSTAAWLDMTPPVSTATIGRPQYVDASGNVFIASFTPISFAASDPTLAGSSVPGSGLSRIEIAVDTTVFTAYVSTLTVPPGPHSIAYRAVDNVGNVEAQVHYVPFQVPPPPTPAVAYSGSSSGGGSGPTYVSTSALAFSGGSPNGPGVASVQYSINGAAFQAASSSVTLPEGSYQVTIQVADLLGVVSDRTITVNVDLTPPVTQIGFTGPVSTTPGGGFAFPANSAVFLTAQDPVSSGVASGVAQTLYAVDAAAPSVYLSTFTLSVGTHTLTYYSVDNVGNVESARAASVAVSSPVLSVVASADGVATLSSYVFGETLAVAVSTPAAAAAAARRLTPATSFYDLSPSGVAFNPPASLRLTFNPGAAASAALAIYYFNGVAWDSAAVAGQGAAVLSSASVRLSGDLAHASLYAAMSPTPAPTLTSLTVTPSSATLTTGATQAFAASGAFSDGSTRTLTATDGLSWTTSGSSVATVDANGLATAVGAGTARVAASSGSVSASATVVVAAAPPSALSVTSVAPSSAAAGATLGLAATGTGFDASAALSLQSWNVLGGTWTAAAAMRSGRILPGAVRLKDGRVLAAGGVLQNGTALTSTEIYDPAAGTWSPAASMATSHFAGAYVLLADGRVLAAGGRLSASGQTTAAVEIYDPAVDAWTPASPLLTARESLAALLPDGRVLLAGDFNNNGLGYLSSVEIYDPVRGVSSAGPAMASGHGAGAIVPLADGRVLVAGGAAAAGAITAAAEIYDPAANAWRPAGAMTSARYIFAAGQLPDGRVVAAGGQSNSVAFLNTSEAYDPATNAWTAGPSMSQARQVRTAAVIGGRMAVIGGILNGAPLSSVEVYDPATNTWKAGPTLGTARWNAPLTALADGRLLTAGGQDVSGSAIASVEALAMPSTTIAATGVAVADAAHLSGTVNLAGAAAGYWDVVVAESGGRVGRLPGGFRVLAPPAPVADLAFANVGPSSATLTWTAPAAPAPLGSYDLRVATFPITAGNFAAASPVAAPVPAAAGTAQTAGVAAGGPVWYAALLSRDSLGGVSALSNVAGLTRSTITIGGVPELVFSAGQPVAQTLLSTSAGNGAVVLASATAQGLVLVSGVYDLGPEKAVFSPPASLTISYSTAALRALGLAPADLLIYEYVAGTGWIAVSSQAPNASAQSVTASVPTLASIFALFGRPHAPPLLTLALASGTTVAASAPVLVARYAAAAYPLDLAGVRLRLDGVDVSSLTAVAASSAQFSASGLVSGAHAASAAAADAWGAVSTAALSFLVDAAPPTSTLSVGAPQYASSGTVYVSTLTPLALSAVDPVVGGVASGVRGVSVAQNGGAFAAYAGTFTLTAPDGTKTLAWYATDNVGNQEAVKSSALVLDATPPQTSLLVVGGRQYPGPDAASFYASSATRFALLAADPVVNGAASGVAWTKYQDGTGAFLTYASTFALAEGAHQLAYQSQDNVANLEVLRSTNAWIDATPPVTTVVIGSPTYTAPDGTIYVTPAAPITFTASDPNLPTGQPGSGLARVEVSVDSAAFAVYTASLAFAEGRHTVAYRSVDNVGNVEATRVLALQSDATPPVTTLAVSTPSFNGFVSAATLFPLSAVDPIGNGVASGVAFTRYRVNGGAFASSPLAFRLSGPDGAYQVDYQSQDNVGNLEVLRSTAVFLDQTPPLTTPHIGAPNYVAADGTQYVTPTTPVTFTSVDPSSGSPASGVNHIEFALDGGAFSVYAATLTFAEGRHSILYRAVDNVGNVEAAKTLSLQSDATPPVTAFKASGAYFAVNAPEGARLYAPLSFSYSLPATDPVVNNVASGVAFTRYRTSQLTSYASGAPTYAPGAFATSASTFSLAEGIRRVDFQSQDNVTNLELLKSATVFVDATPPATTLTVGAPQYSAGGTLYVSTVTPFSLASQDPMVQEVASGVSGIFFHLDANPFAPYSSTFTIPVPDGAHSASFYAADNVGNLETIKTSTVALDATPPQTSLAILGGHQFPGPDNQTFYASADTRFALPAVDPVVNGVASGLAFTRWRDNGGAFQAYLSTLSFTEGAHTLGYQSQDNVANLEVLRSTNAWIDATPPVTTVAIGSPTYTAPDGTIYVTPATPIAFAAVDPNLPSGQTGSGVARIEVSLDGGAFATYTATLKLPEGRHAILYRAVDNVANVETSRTLAVQSDATPPVSSLAIGQPQFQLPGILLVSSRTSFAVAAVDPVVNNVASGVKDSWYNWADLAPSTSAFQQFTATFTLSGLDVNKVISFYSRDNVLNTEAVKSSTVLLDSTPPEIALLSPAACDSGICRVIKGKLPVLGTATDAHFASYRLDFAPGQSATTGYALISSGTVAVSSGALGTWDASALAGWQTLRLTATDLVANVSVLTINVFVGDPATLMLLGNHETFDMPTGVAAGVGGAIYVADRDNDRIAVFTSTGGLAGVFGGRRDDHQDGDKVSTTTLRLHEPSGVAVDAAGNIYIADTGHHRVLELSPSGRVLLDLGRRKVERDDGGTKTAFASGKAPGEFRHPLGVAVDAAGNIYVADTGNSRVQVFTSTGGFALQFALPALPTVPEGDDREAGEKDDDAPALGRPAGIAVDAAGDIYLADLTGRRALRYDPSGRLTLAIPIPGDKPNQPGRPYGIAISTSGNCLLVSDMQFARVLKFDMNGVQNLTFGARARDDDDKRKAPGIALRKPAGLALDAAGNLYVADRNAEKIEKFGLPTGQPTLVVPPPGPGDDDTARDVVSREDGGKVERKDKAAVAIPAQALSDDLKVSVGAPAADVAAAGARGAQDKDLRTASPPVDFGPEGTKFQAPVTLTLPYSPDLLAQQNGDETSLKVHYWNKAKGQWEELATQVDAQKRTVTAKTTHFSLYQVFATSTSAVKPLATADPTFAFHDGYAFPNPVRGASVVTLRIQPGLADSVEVRVYDISGRKVHSASDFTQSILDDGNGKGNQYTFDHVWNVSGVGSGVYLYVITAKKAGASDIHKTGKVGVIK